MPSRALAIVAALVLGSCVVAATVADYGIGWDETAQATYGELTYEYFASGGADRRANEFLDLYLYGPLFETTAALLYVHDLEAKYVLRHALVAFTGLLTLLAVVQIGTRSGLPYLALFAGLGLALMPRFYGHAFINSKDVPFACAMAWSMFCVVRFVEVRGDWPRTLLLGLAAGIALALRPGGAPLLALLFGAAFAYAWSRGGGSVRLLGRGVAALGLAWGVMLVGWPWAHENPLLHPLRAMGAALAFPTAYEVLFDGEVMRSDALPRSYFPRFLLLTTPLPVLGLACVGALLCARDAWRARDRTQASALFAWLVPLWLLLPLASAAVLRPNVYDGLRHVLFVLPAIALLAARAAAEAVQRSGSGPLRPTLLVLLLAALALPAWQLVRLHPYQMTYFNVLAGGVEGASGRYETDYWVTSYREAAEWLNARAAEAPDGLRVIAAVDAYSEACIAEYLVDSVELVGVSEAPATPALPPGFDYYVATTRYQLDQRYPESAIVHEIGRGGAVFSVVRGRVPEAPRSAGHGDTE